ncbi:MAG: hypothetical protein ACXACX_21360 [Candidatus Hodarchaeales archaeon]
MIMMIPSSLTNLLSVPSYQLLFDERDSINTATSNFIPTFKQNRLFINEFFIIDDYEFDSNIKITQDKQGFLYTFARVKRGSTSFYNNLIIKWDKNGTLLWEKEWNHNGMDIIKVSKLKVDNIGNIYTIGSAYDTSGSGQRVSIISKLNSNGELEWNKFYSRIDWHPQLPFDGESLSFDQLGNILIAGSAGSGWSGFNVPNAYVAKINTNGSFIWNVTTSNQFEIFGKDIIADGENNVFLLAEYGATTYILKYTSNGVYLWQKTWSGAYNHNQFLFLKYNNTFFIGQDAIGSFNSKGSLVSETRLASSDLKYLDSDLNIFTLKFESNHILLHKWDSNGEQNLDYFLNYTFSDPNLLITGFAVDQNTTYTVGISGNHLYLASLTESNNIEPVEATTTQQVQSSSETTPLDPNNDSPTALVTLAFIIVAGAVFIFLVSKRQKKELFGSDRTLTQYKGSKYDNLASNQEDNVIPMKGTPIQRKICRFCNGVIREGDIFCLYCGNKLV